MGRTTTRQIPSVAQSFNPKIKMVLPVDNPTKSYWIEAAESPLRNFRSTDILPQETDVVIVGSGYTGASTAYWLHKVGNLSFPF